MLGEIDMLKRTCLTLVCCSFTSLSVATDRFIIKYKPTPAQSKSLASGGMQPQKAMEQMSKPLSTVHKKELSKLADGLYIYEVNQIATGAHVIILSKDLNPVETKNFIKKVEEQPDVEYIEEDRILKPTTSINQAYQWDFYTRAEYTPQPEWIGDNFFDAWSLLNNAGFGVGSGVVVGVLDTGYTPHANFINSLQQLGSANGVYGYQFISDCRVSGQCSPSTPEATASNYPYQANALDLGDYVSQSDITSSNGFFTYDCYSPTSSWHGSHVTGIISADGYTQANSSYIAGGAYDDRVVPIRALGKCGGYISDITNGMLWAAGLPVSSNGVSVPANPNPVQVINLSLGGSGPCTHTEQDTINAINNMTNGAIIVVAAGNSRDDISNFNPASCDGVISVAAKGPTNVLASYSNYGATTLAASGGDSGVMACYTDNNGQSVCPSKIYSTVWSSRQAYQSSGSSTFAFYQGTSMATPHVSAAVADIIGVLRSRGENYTFYGIKTVLQQTARSYDNCSAFGCAGTGALDVAAAIAYVLSSSVPVVPPPAPLVSTGGASGGGGGGGCSAIQNGDDYSLILLLIIGSVLYACRKQIYKQKPRKDG
jgi:serine protease